MKISASVTLEIQFKRFKTKTSEGSETATHRKKYSAKTAAPNPVSSNQMIFFFLSFDLDFMAFQEYFTYIELIVHRRWAKARVPNETPPDLP